MLIANWRQLNQLSINELDAIVFSNNACFRQLVEYGPGPSITLRGLFK